MHKSEAEKIDSILDEHQQIYRRHNRIDVSVQPEPSGQNLTN